MRHLRIGGQMSFRGLKTLLDQVPETPGPRPPREPAWNALFDAWSDAHEEAEGAWRTWRSGPGPEPYAAYRAAADREDAAQDAVTAAARREEAAQDAVAAAAGR